MTTKTEDNRATAWAAEAGAALARRRAARTAEREAEAEHDAGREAVPVEELRRRFSAPVLCLLDALERFARAAELRLEAAPPAATLLELRAHDGREALRVVLEDDAAVVTWRSPSRAETSHVRAGLCVVR